MHGGHGAVNRLGRNMPRCGLYVISGGPRDDILARTEAALRGGAVMVQYRDKTIDRERRAEEARALRAACVRYDARLIINDDIELTQTVRAHGVHLGETDATPSAARAALGSDAIIGVSCYADLSRARQLAALDVDYLALGAFYPSPTKPHARRAHPQLLHDARELGLPLVAIGGITPDNGAALIAAGADFLAVISGVFAAPDTEAAARHYSALFTTSIPKP